MKKKRCLYSPHFCGTGAPSAVRFDAAGRWGLQELLRSGKGTSPFEVRMGTPHKKPQYPVSGFSKFFFSLDVDKKTLGYIYLKSRSVW